MYNSTLNAENQQNNSNFSYFQANPRKVCPHRRRSLEVAVTLDLPYVCNKCYRARCSMECYRNWARKHASCVAKVLQERPEGTKVLRGSLTMPLDSLPNAHKRTKKEFVRILNRYKFKHDKTLEFHATIHVTDRLNCHWDIVCYSDIAIKSLKAMVSEAWNRAGGKRNSLVLMSDNEVAAQTKYQTKDLRTETREHVLLPSPQSELGLDVHWSTRGFWGGESIDEVWKRLVKEWYDDDEDNGDPITNVRVVSNNKYTTLEPNIRQETIEKIDHELAIKASKHKAYKAVQDHQAIRIQRNNLIKCLGDFDHESKVILEDLPTSPKEAPTFAQLAKRWALDPHHVRCLAINNPNITILKSEGNRDKFWIHDQCYREDPLEAPTSPSERFSDLWSIFGT